MENEYMDRNPLLQNKMNPVPNLGVIPGKARLDYYLIEECQKNAEDSTVSATCYKGGSNDKNHDAYPGDSSYGLKCVRSIDVMEGEPNELGIVSVAGINRAAYSSLRALESQFYWQGFVATESRLTNALNSNTSDPDHGYATIRTGTVSVSNNGPGMFYPGSYVAYQFPKHPVVDGVGSAVMKEMPDGTLINATARGGTEAGQFCPELVPFNPYDVSTEIAGAIAGVNESINARGTPGIKGMTLDQFLKYDCIPEAKSCSAEQELSGGFKFGKAGAVLFGGLEVLAQRGFIVINPTTTGTEISKTDAIRLASQLANDIGLFDEKIDDQIVHEILNNIYFADLPVNHPGGRTAREEFQAYLASIKADTAIGTLDIKTLPMKTNYKNNPTINYAKMRVLGSSFDMGAFNGAWFAKRSKIIGRSMNCRFVYYSIIHIYIFILTYYIQCTRRYPSRSCW